MLQAITDIETPAALIDDRIVERNIERLQSYCNQHGIALRPHIKTHKLPEYAHRQLRAGAVGITCQKLSEAEVMAAAGVRDILITYNIVGEAKLTRLLSLAERLERLRVVADNDTVVNGLARTFQNRAEPLDVLVECDTGAGRCGVQTPAAAVRLARRIVDSAGITFAGLMTYPAVGGGAAVAQFVDDVRSQLRNHGIECAIVSSGGTPDMWKAADVAGITEYRAGTYIYNDRSLVHRGTCQWDDCALTVLVTVVSTPADERAIIDAGSKTLTSDLLGMTGYGHVLGHENVTVAALSEEHGILTWTGPSRFTVGQRLQIVPNHVCVVSNMLDQVWIHSDGHRARQTQVAARGCVT